MGNSRETRVYIDGGATPESLGLTLPTEIDDKELGLHVDLKTAIWPSPSIKAGGLKGWKMPERKTKMLIFGAEMDVVDVPFEPTIEHLNQYKLEDGSVVNVKAVVMSFIRIEGQFTAEEMCIRDRDGTVQSIIAHEIGGVDEGIQSWDCAFKDLETSDYVVGQVWGRRGSAYVLLDQVRDRMDCPTTVKAVRHLSQQWRGTIVKLIEDKALSLIHI